jgi:hypothetical protein
LARERRLADLPRPGEDLDEPPWLARPGERCLEDGAAVLLRHAQQFTQNVE